MLKSEISLLGFVHRREIMPNDTALDLKISSVLRVNPSPYGVLIASLSGSRVSFSSRFEDHSHITGAVACLTPH